jgi:hypothetical protein
MCIFITHACRSGVYVYGIYMKCTTQLTPRGTIHIDTGTACNNSLHTITTTNTKS